MRLIKTLEVANELGEGVIWDNPTQLFWWTDIQGRKLFSYSVDNDELNEWSTPERLACFALRANGQGLVAAFESGFAFYQVETGEVEWIQKLESDNSGTRFNDGRTDRQGRLWAGTMVEDAKNASYKGSLYCLDHDLSVRKTISNLSIPNSLCWSPDGTILYHTDTPSQQINAYTFSPESGEIGSVRALVHTQSSCYPDGSTIDTDGYLWNAQWGGRQVVRYAPNGEEDLVLEIPTAQPSCVAFGGENLNLLCVTSAWQDMDDATRNADSEAGNLFIYETEFTGLIESEFIET